MRTADRERGEMLASAAAGDELAFRGLIAEHHEDMRRVCLAIFHDHSVAEDAAQAAWPMAWKKLDRVHGPEQLRPWLVSVAVNEAKQLMRKRRRRAEIEISADASAEPGGVDPASRVSSFDLCDAMARLDPDDRALLAMRYVAGFDSNELSASGPAGRRSNHLQAASTAGRPRWRPQPLLRATSYIAAGIIVALFGGFLLVGVVTQPTGDGAPAAGGTASPEGTPSALPTQAPTDSENKENDVNLKTPSQRPWPPACSRHPRRQPSPKPI